MGFLSWHSVLQGQSTRLVHGYQNYRDTRTPSGVPHQAQRTKDTVRNTGRKPWLCVCRNAVVFEVPNIGGGGVPLIAPSLRPPWSIWLKDENWKWEWPYWLIDWRLVWSRSAWATGRHHFDGSGRRRRWIRNRWRDPVIKKWTVRKNPYRIIHHLIFDSIPWRLFASDRWRAAIRRVVRAKKYVRF